MNFERISISHQAVDVQARFRLKRLGIAVNQWVADHGFNRFPQITNPPQATRWDPQRLASAYAILGQYLQGDVPMIQRQDESAEEFYQRRLKNELTVDPQTGFEFWYNVQLRDRQPDQLVNDDHSTWYFRSQRDLNGNWPYRHQGEEGTWMVAPSLIQRQITQQDLNQMRQRLDQLERENEGLPPSEWSHDLEFLRREVRRLETLHREHGEGSSDQGRVLTQLGLEQQVRFISGEEIISGPRNER